MPFAKTALFPSTPESLLHFNMVRARVTGFGNLKLTMNSMDEEKSVDLVDLKIPKKSDSAPRVLANFISQRVSLEISVTTINEWFDINSITLYTIFQAAEGPQ